MDHIEGLLPLQQQQPEVHHLAAGNFEGFEGEFAFSFREVEGTERGAVPVLHVGLGSGRTVILRADEG